MEIDEFKNLILDYTKKITDSTDFAFNTVGSRYGVTMMQLRILRGA